LLLVRRWTLLIALVGDDGTRKENSPSDAGDVARMSLTDAEDVRE